MKVSFIVPVYNVEKYISECIDSILKQTRHNYEIILVDDGSKDNSGLICNEYADKYFNISVIHQTNQGVSVARNKGMSACSGEWIFFVDGDDTVSERLIESAEEFLNDEYDVCFVKHKEVMDGYSVGKAREQEKIIFGQDAFREFELAVFNRDLNGQYDYHEIKMATPCKFYRKKILEENEIYFPKGVKTGEDALFNLQVYKFSKKGAYVGEELYYHRIWDNSVSQKYDSDAEKKFAVLHKKLREYIEQSGETERFEQVYGERCLWSLGFCCMLNYCNRLNPDGYRMRKKTFEADRIKYYPIIKDVDLNHYRMEKKILFFGIKKNWFWFVNLLCVLKAGIKN